MHTSRFALWLAVVLLAGIVARADAAPVLTLTLQPTKAFRFSWTPVPGATHYKLLEDPTGSAGFTQVGGNIAAPALTMEHIVPLYRRINARYRVQACDVDSCVNSNTVTVSGTLAQAIGYFKASNPNVEDRFGQDVALSSDGATLAVSAWLEDSASVGVNGDQGNNAAQDSGAVYVFVRNGNGSGWMQQAYIKASNTNRDDEFGYRLALSANGSVLAVGAYREDGVAPQSGAAYVFVRSGSTWTQQAYLKASNAAAGDRFGSAVALSGDGRTLAVGAMYEDSNAVGVDGNQANDLAHESGAVYVFVRAGSAWSQQAYLKASNTDADDNFGEALDLTSDGSLLAVSADNESSAATGVDGDQGDNSARAAGAVYLFERLAGSLWTQQAYIKASNTDAFDNFGSSVTLSANGLVLAVGANDEDSGASGLNGQQDDESAIDAGAVYVFARRDSVWAQQAYMKASNPGAPDGFGWVVALSNDGATLAVGAFHEDSSAIGVNGDQADNSTVSAGAAYVFGRNNGVWTQLSYVKAFNTAPGAWFGISLALAGNAGTLAVGASGESNNWAGINGPPFTPRRLLGSGAVYVY